MKKKFIAKLLVLAMVLAMVPVTILAAAAEEPTAPEGPGGPEGSMPTDYSYNIAADTEVTEIPDDGVIVIKPQGGIANAVIKEEVMDALAVEDDSVVLKLDTTDAQKVSVTLPATALVTKTEENGEGLRVECTQAKITIPGAQLAKAIEDAETLAIVVDVADDDVTVSVYVDWVFTKVPGTTVEAL